MKVRIYFRKDIIWYYQLINGEPTNNSLIYALDRNHTQKIKKYQDSLKYGLAQRPDKKDITKTLDMRRRIILT